MLVRRKTLGIALHLKRDHDLRHAFHVQKIQDLLYAYLNYETQGNFSAPRRMPYRVPLATTQHAFVSTYPSGRKLVELTVHSHAHQEERDAAQLLERDLILGEEQPPHDEDEDGRPAQDRHRHARRDEEHSEEDGHHPQRAGHVHRHEVEPHPRALIPVRARARVGRERAPAHQGQEREDGVLHAAARNEHEGRVHLVGEGLVPDAVERQEDGARHGEDDAVLGRGGQRGSRRENHRWIHGFVKDLEALGTQ